MSRSTQGKIKTLREKVHSQVRMSLSGAAGAPSCMRRTKNYLKLCFHIIMLMDERKHNENKI